MTVNRFQELLINVPGETKKFVEKQGEIAALIATVLKKRSIKQKEFAKEIGMKESQLSKILAGNANLTIKTISKIELALGTNIIEIPNFKQKETTVTKVVIVNLSQYSSERFRPDDLRSYQTEMNSHNKIEIKDLDFNQFGDA